MKNRQFCNLTILLASAFLLFFSATSNALARPLETFKTDAGLFNPAQGPLVIRYQLSKDAEEVEARIFDFRGQVVDSFVFISVRAGDHSLTWDGTDNNGKRVLDGRYQIRIKAELSDGTTDAATVDVMVAWLKDPAGVQVPEPLPAEEFPYTVLGSLSTFYRHNIVDPIFKTTV